MSESKTPTPEPVGFYCDHSDEEPGKRTHEGWEWTDEERAWKHQPTIVSSHATPHEWDKERRLCPRAVPVYAVDVPALLAEVERLRRREDSGYLVDILTGSVLIGADDAIGMLRALIPELTAIGELTDEQAGRVHAGLDKQAAERDRLAEQVKRVRARHYPVCGGACGLDDTCECEDRDLICAEDNDRWPCPTRRDLDGTEAGS